ncbi:aspartic peptidase domain-containing protein [Cantharellus anzutake]|uniref:aspartic peptidase domain-containing protein n=1 Tax=Cantharellus anzutake TaxID=1750568 RepID=UPI001906644C|nr:aspartic peptidase domain-containing protein [Cantharellus anzutake]KAF8339773.1 aspartic peptidase domain-containing protein [Cantharellus anzutake]
MFVIPAFWSLGLVALCLFSVDALPSGINHSNGILLRLDRRAHPVTSPTTDTSKKIFDQNFVKQEIKAVLYKYRQAAKWISSLRISNSNRFNVISDSLPPSLTNSNGSVAPVGATPQLETQTRLRLTDYMSGTLDVLYFGYLGFGTPPQTLSVDIDTGSADMWVSSDCSDCQTKQFDSMRSTTYQSTTHPFNVFYGTGSVTGHMARDRVAAGSLEVSQDFGVVNQDNDALAGSPVSGLLGMAFSTIAVSEKPTFFENLWDQKKIQRGYFSVHLERNKAQGSELCLGCIDMGKALGSMTWASLASRSYWSVNVDRINIDTQNNRTVHVNLVAVVDTGTTLVYLPNGVAESLYNQIPGARRATQFGDGFWTYPCASTLAIGFVIDGNSYSISPFDFNLGRTSTTSTECVAGILSIGDGFPPGLAILGDEFLKSWYTTYDYENGGRIGFAPSINNRPP